MEVLPENKVLKFNTNTLDSVRKMYELDKPGAMRQAVDILEEWIKSQAHFTKKDFDRHYLELTIIASKGSLERAKQRLDKSCTLRTLMPQYFVEYDLRNDRGFAEDLKDIIQVPLPRLTKDNDRVYILRNVGKKFESTLLLNYTRFMVLASEYIRRHDYLFRGIVILDYRELHLSELATKLNPVEMNQLFTVLIEGYGFRIKEIHFISNSKLIDIIVTIFKQVLPRKIKDRIIVHQSIETLAETVDKDILPEEYGGNEKSLDKLYKDWLEELSTKEHAEYHQEMNKARTNESLRQTGKFNEEYMGMPGSFRTLNVD